jgi:hypothetical protein
MVFNSAGCLMDGRMIPSSWSVLSEHDMTERGRYELGHRQSSSRQSTDETRSSGSRPWNHQNDF